MTIIRAVLLMHALLVVAGAPLAAQASIARTVPDGSVRRGLLSFDARATAGDFTGTTTSVTGQMNGGALTAVRGWVEAPVRTLATGNKRRDRDLNKSMESGKYPVIRFELTNVAAPESPGDSINVVLHGRFMIHGVTRETSVPASLIFQNQGIRLLGETPINLKDYKIGGLSKALGMLKMSEKIAVHIDILFGTGPLQQARR